VVSDGRGHTCDQLVQAALLQFDDQSYRVERRSDVRTVEGVEAVVCEAKASNAIVFYTLVSTETQQAMKLGAENNLLVAVDLLGPVISALHDLFRTSPKEIPGLLYESNQENFDRFEAIDFTLKHDDGQRPHELDRAHVVLVGVSRASKSSTCFCLAYEGIRAANVPLIPELSPPPQLLGLDPSKVIGLRINPLRLRSVRQARLESMGVSTLDNYVDKRRIASEILAANQLMKRYGWHSIDVSYKAIEEIARRVKEIGGWER
jgi:regulator of PEP synthase PpsR (kinase-PPPase family)